MSRSSLMGAVVMAGMALSGGQPLAQVSCGSTINQNTTLTADLNNCPGNGVVIGASGITLDLGGHTIDGDGDDVGNGVDNTQGHDQVTIENGRIREFGTGVRLANADRNRLRELVASYNSEGIFLSDSITTESREIRRPTMTTQGLPLPAQEMGRTIIGSMKTPRPTTRTLV